MAIAQTHTNPDDDFFKTGPDATATFDNFIQRANSENLHVLETEDDDDELEDEDLDEDEEYDEEEDEEDEEDQEDSN